MSHSAFVHLFCNSWLELFLFLSLESIYSHGTPTKPLRLPNIDLAVPLFSFLHTKLMRDPLTLIVCHHRISGAPCISLTTFI